MSKGSNRRPSAVPDAVLEENWRRTFGTKEKQSAFQEALTAAIKEEMAGADGAIKRMLEGAAKASLPGEIMAP